ncbi:hypothetical protein ACWERV_27395 [Streptomyces sp. NPDC004031]
MQVVSSGQKISVGGGSVWLTSKGLTLAPSNLGSAGPTVLPVAGVLPGKVSTVAGGSSSGVVWAGVFRLPATATTSVTVGGVKANVVTLSGNPGWGAFYAFGAKGTADAKPAILIHNWSRLPLPSTGRRQRPPRMPPFSSAPRSSRDDDRGNTAGPASSRTLAGLDEQHQ